MGACDAEDQHRGRADETGGRRREIEQQRARSRVSRREQNREVAHLLRNLVRRDRERRRHAKRERDETRGGDDDAVNERVERVADDDQRDGARMDLARVVVVAVPPDDELLENEEGENAGEERREHRRRGNRGERLRNQIEQRDAEQRAHRIRHQPRDDAFPRVLIEKKKQGCGQEAAEAAGHGQPEHGRPDEHGLILVQRWADRPDRGAARVGLPVKSGNHEAHEGHEEEPLKISRDGETPADLAGPASPGCDLLELAIRQDDTQVQLKSCRIAGSDESPGRRRRQPGQRCLRVLRELRGSGSVTRHQTRLRRDKPLARSHDVVAPFEPELDGVPAPVLRHASRCSRESTGG